MATSRGSAATTATMATDYTGHHHRRGANPYPAVNKSPENNGNPMFKFGVMEDNEGTTTEFNSRTEETASSLDVHANFHNLDPEEIMDKLARDRLNRDGPQPPIRIPRSREPWISKLIERMWFPETFLGFFDLEDGVASLAVFLISDALWTATMIYNLTVSEHHVRTSGNLQDHPSKSWLPTGVKVWIFIDLVLDLMMSLLSLVGVSESTHKWRKFSILMMMVMTLIKIIRVILICVFMEEGLSPNFDLKTMMIVLAVLSIFVAIFFVLYLHGISIKWEKANKQSIQTVRLKQRPRE